MALFADLPLSTQERMNSIGQERSLAAGECLINQDDVDHILYLVESGELGGTKTTKSFGFSP